MRTKIQTIAHLKNMFVEMVLNKTNKITKIADNSVLSGMAYGVAKLFQRGMKDQSLVESELFPEMAYGDDLDLIALRQGLSERYGSSNSSVVVKLVAERGTVYDTNKHICITADGKRFKLSKNIVIGELGYSYAIANSLQVGETSIIGPREIVRILNPPLGHKYITNESMAVGGRSSESDKIFRNRISEGFNILTTDTLSRLQQIFISLNSNVLDVKKVGRDSKGYVILGIVTQNGVDLTSEEFDYLIDMSKRYLSLTDIKPYNNEVIGLKLQNVQYTYIDVDFEVDLNQNTDLKDFAINIQTAFLSYCDWRFWDENKKVEWDDLLMMVKSQPEVKYVPDNKFNPATDIIVNRSTVPRLRKFIIRALGGKILFENDDISTSKENEDALYYQNQFSENYVNSVLSNI